MAVSQQGASLATLLGQVVLVEMVGIMLAHAFYAKIFSDRHTYIIYIYIYIENIIYLSKFLSIYLPTNQPINQSIIHYMPGSFEFNFGDSQFEPGVQSY